MADAPAAELYFNKVASHDLCVCVFVLVCVCVRVCVCELDYVFVSTYTKRIPLLRRRASMAWG
jgi:hypothetical protein